MVGWHHRLNGHEYGSPVTGARFSRGQSAPLICLPACFVGRLGLTGSPAAPLASCCLFRAVVSLLSSVRLCVCVQVPGPNPHEVVSGKQWKGHPSGGEHPCSAFAGTCLMPRAQSRSGVARKPHESTGQGRELQGEALPSCCVRTCCCC